MEQTAQKESAPVEDPTPILHVAAPWPGVDDVPSYDVLRIEPEPSKETWPGQVMAQCHCATACNGRGAWWHWPVRALPGLTDEQRAALLVGVAPGTNDGKDVASADEGQRGVSVHLNGETADSTLLDFMLLTVDDYRSMIGKPTAITWGRLAQLLSPERSKPLDPNLDPKIAKSMRGAWVGATCGGNHRAAENFLSTRTIGFDIDKNGSVELAARAFGPFRKIIASSASSTPTCPRCRVILMLSKPCSDRKRLAEAHKVMRARLVVLGFYATEDIDTAGSDPERLWYLPMHLPGVQPEGLSTDGELLDLDRLAPPPAPKRASGTRPPPIRGEHAGAVRWASEQIRSAPKKHNVRRNAARWLAELGVDEPTIWGACFDEHQDDETARAAVAWGIEKGRGL